MEEENIVNDEESSTNNSIDTSNDETSKKDNSQENDNEEETYKQRYSDSSRESKRIMQVHKAYREVLKDNSHLLDLDSKLAKDVVAQLHEDWYSDTDSLEELIASIKGEASDDKPLDKEKLAKEIRKQILDEQNQEQAQEILDTALAKFDNKTKNLFLEDFKEIAGDRKLTPKFAKKEIDKIIVYYNREQTKKDRDDEVLSNLWSNGLWSWKSTSKTAMTIWKLEELWIPKNQQKTLYPELFTK